MSARDAILAAVRSKRATTTPRPAPYSPPPLTEDAVTMFGAQATRVAAEVRRLGNLREVPAAVADILRSRNLAARVHVPEQAKALYALPWDLAPGLDIETTRPGGNDAAVAFAPYAIAETGTLVYPATNDAPASWHFRAGLEIAILSVASIQPDFESVLARIKADGALPPTLNLVTGPSRTADIEQTLELGAHGPRALVILIVNE